MSFYSPDPQEALEALNKAPRASIEEEKFPFILQGSSGLSKRKSNIDTLTGENQIYFVHMELK